MALKTTLKMARLQRTGRSFISLDFKYARLRKTIGYIERSNGAPAPCWSQRNDGEDFDH
jgi:hypothetical protein